MDAIAQALTTSHMNGGASIYISSGTELPHAPQEAIDMFQQASADYETTPACSHGTCPQLTQRMSSRKNVLHQRIVTFRGEVQALLEQ